MALAQNTARGAAADPSPKLKMDQSTNVVLNSDFYTMMVWAYSSVAAIGDGAYADIMCVRDSTVGGDPSDDKVVAIYHKDVSTNWIVSMGDDVEDIDGGVRVPANQWRHYTLVSQDMPTQEVCITSYLDGAQQRRALDAVTDVTPPIFPNNDCFIQLFNSRSSASDSSSIWQGHMAGFKCWNNVALTPEEIRREMWTYVPIRKAGLYSALPMINKAHSVFDLTGKTWTVTGADFADSNFNPPGVQWEAPISRRFQTYYNPAWFVDPPPRYILGTH